MTVQQLIIQLTKLPSNAIVYGWDDGSIFVVDSEDNTIECIDTEFYTREVTV